MSRTDNPHKIADARYEVVRRALQFAAVDLVNDGNDPYICADFDYTRSRLDEALASYADVRGWRDSGEAS